MFTCEACAESRPEDMIEVFKVQVINSDITFDRNVNYCVDRPECLEKAKEIGERFRRNMEQPS